MQDGDEKEAASTPKRRRSHRNALLVLAGLAVLEAAYVVVGNHYLRRVLPGRLNAEPDRQLCTWSRASTWWPGVVTVHDFRLRRQHPDVQWEARADRARAHVGLLPLLFHRMRVTGLDASGCSFRLRFVPSPGSGPAAGSPHAPPIEGLPDPPVTLEQAALIPDPPLRDWRWTFVLKRWSAKDVRELWIGPFRFTGSSALEATAHATPGREVEVSRFDLDIGSGEVSVGGDTFVTEIRGELKSSLDTFEVDEEYALDALTELSARVDLSGLVHDVQLPRTRFPRIPWLGFGGGTGNGQMSIVLEDGALRPGSSLRLAADGFQLVYPGYVVEGKALIQGAVSEGDGLGRVGATFEAFAIKKDGAPSAHVRGEGFSAELRTEDLTLRHPLETFEVELRLPESEIVDFDAYDASIPAPLRVDVDSGRGTMTGYLRISEKDSEGRLDVTGRDVVLSYEGETLRTSLELATVIRSASMQSGEFDLSGSELHLHDGSVVEKDGAERRTGWWGDIALPVLRLHRGADVVAELEADATFKDTRPFVAIVAADRPLLKLFRPALMAKEPKVTAKLRSGPNLLDLESLVLRGEGLVVRACMDLGPADPRGVVLVDSGALSAGVKFAGGARNVKPLAGERWYVENAPLCDDPTFARPD